MMRVEAVPDVSVGGTLATGQNGSLVERCLVATGLQPAPTMPPLMAPLTPNYTDLAPGCKFSNTFNLAG